MNIQNIKEAFFKEKLIEYFKKNISNEYKSAIGNDSFSYLKMFHTYKEFLTNNTWIYFGSTDTEALFLLTDKSYFTVILKQNIIPYKHSNNVVINTERYIDMGLNMNILENILK